MNAKTETQPRAKKATTLLMVKRNSMRPAKKRKTDVCKRRGIASTARDNLNLSAPWCIYALRSTRVRGAPWACAYPRYLRAHCCINVARSAQDKLRIKLRNHSTLTLIIEAGASNELFGITTGAPEALLTSWVSNATV